MIRSFRYPIVTSFLFTLFLGGCGSSSQITDWRDIPKNQPVNVVTRSGSQFHFTTCTAMGDTVLLGVSDSSFYKIPRDSVASVTTTGPTTFNFISPLIGGLISIALVALLVSIAHST